MQTKHQAHMHENSRTSELAEIFMVKKFMNNRNFLRGVLQKIQMLDCWGHPIGALPCEFISWSSDLYCLI